MIQIEPSPTELGPKQCCNVLYYVELMVVS